MARYVLMIYGRARLRALRLDRRSPAPGISLNKTNGPWKDNWPDGATQAVYSAFPSTARFHDGVDLEDPGSGANWALTVQIRARGPAQLTAIVFEKTTGNVVCKLRPRLSAAGQKTRSGDFNL